MRLNFYLLFFLFSTFLLTNGQTKEITGKIVSEDLKSLYKVYLVTKDTTILVDCDSSGIFKIDIPLDSKEIMLTSLGVEPKFIELSNFCSFYEVILGIQSTYDFMTIKKVERLRKKAFERIVRLRKVAFQNGIFKSGISCYNEKFLTSNEIQLEFKKYRFKKPSS